MMSKFKKKENEDFITNKDKYGAKRERWNELFYTKTYKKSSKTYKKTTTQFKLQGGAWPKGGITQQLTRIHLL